MASHSRGDRGGNKNAFSLPTMLGGPRDPQPDVLTLRWLGTANFELTFGGRVVLLDCFYDRGPRMRPLSFSPKDVVRADQKRGRRGSAIALQQNFRARKSKFVS